jgi:hypothetical protein
MTKKSFIYFLLLTFTLGLVSSCVDLDVEKEYLADVYMLVKVEGGDTLYAVESYIESNAILDSVTMKSPDGSKEFVLKPLSTGYFEYSGGKGAFTSQKPQAGNYTFNILFDDGTSVTTIDNLTDKTIDPVQVNEVVASESGGSIVVKWQKNLKANFYSIKVYKKDEMLFSSGFIDTVYSAATIYAYSGGWATNKNPDAGDSLNVVVNGMLCEKDLTKYYEFQAISLSEQKPFVWPE